MAASNPRAETEATIDRDSNSAHMNPISLHSSTKSQITDRKSPEFTTVFPQLIKNFNTIGVVI